MFYQNDQNSSQMTNPQPVSGFADPMNQHKQYNFTRRILHNILLATHEVLQVTEHTQFFIQILSYLSIGAKGVSH